MVFLQRTEMEPGGCRADVVVHVECGDAGRSDGGAGSGAERQRVGGGGAGGFVGVLARHAHGRGHRGG